MSESTHVSVPELFNRTLPSSAFAIVSLIREIYSWDRVDADPGFLALVDRANQALDQAEDALRRVVSHLQKT